jgi:peptide/nickel transport system permease protein
LATNKPILEQFFIYVTNVVRGDFGFSFSQYPRTVAECARRVAVVDADAANCQRSSSAGRLGNMLGALAAYLEEAAFDKVLMPSSPLSQQLPALWHGRSSCWSSLR